jgi:hypothetical protein
MKEMSAKYNELIGQYQSGSITKSNFDIQKYQLTGQPPARGDEFSDTMNGLSHLMGEYIPLEGAGGKFVPSPPWLKWYTKQQFVVVPMVIYAELIALRRLVRDENLPVSQAISNSCS